MKPLRLLWEFSRPHTLVGSAISVSVLGFMSLGAQAFWLPAFWLALASALCCNIFITGYNQVVDVALDRVNKPWLPLASGALSMQAGRIIVWSFLGMALFLSVLADLRFLGLISVIALLGFAYSWKHTFLKKRHGTAALAITLVRGILVNVGFYSFFSGWPPPGEFPGWLWLLALFVCLFSMGIAWYKDIPDLKGDSAYAIGTLAVRLGAPRVFRLATTVVMLAYLVGLVWPFVMPMAEVEGTVISAGHLLLGTVFLAFAAKTAPAKTSAMKRFYMLFWVLFFFEYALFALAKVWFMF